MKNPVRRHMQYRVGQLFDHLDWVNIWVGPLGLSLADGPPK